MLAHWLIDVDDFASPESLALFQKELPLEWIHQALDETNKASMRRRKLPAELVVWLLVGIGLYRDRPITAGRPHECLVFRHLTKTST